MIAVAAWTGPAVLAVIAVRVFTGDALAPVMLLLVGLAPLIALARPYERVPATPAHAALALPGLACIVAANAVVVADLARPEGIPRWVAPSVVFLLAAVPLVVKSAETWSLTAAVALFAAAIPVVVAGLVTATTPWTAWGQVASRSALTFTERSGWVTDGGTLTAPTTLTFDEPHRVTALAPAVWRVTELDAGRATTRDRRLEAGEAVTLRPGEQLMVDAGARLRFERGKRVPGASPNGVEWADPPARRSIGGGLAALSLTVSVLGAALALVPPVHGVAATTAVASAATPITLAVVAACTGTYAVYVAPELGLAGGLGAPLFELPAAVVGRASATSMTAVAVVAILGLFAASCAALAARVERVVSAATAGATRPIAPLVWLSIAAGAAAATLIGADGARWLVVGCGLLAATWGAPVAAGAPPRATLVGAGAGAVVFALLTALGTASPTAGLGDYPALVAAPVAWAVAWLFGCRALRPLTQ